jgi:hypothetical protein
MIRSFSSSLTHATKKPPAANWTAFNLKRNDMPNVEVNSNLTNYENWQLQVYGNVISPVGYTPESEMYESGLEELDRMAEWINSQAEQSL